MLPRFLSLLVLAFSLVSAATVDQTRLQPVPREVILPCARCAFSESQCSGDVVHDTDSYLTITFSIENNTLLANQHPVFPPSFAMQLPATRHDASGRDEPVSLSYMLDARPVPVQSRPGQETYLLKMKLLDSLGKLASDYVILVGVTSSSSDSSSSASLSITEINTSPIPRPYSHHRHDPQPSGHEHRHGHVKSWLVVLTSSAKEFMRVFAHPFSSSRLHLNSNSNSKPNNDDTLTSSSPSNSNLGPKPNSKSNPNPNNDPHRTVDHRSHHAWHGHGHVHSLHKGFGRLVRPVVVPALLGAGTGIMACVMGFLIGRVVVMVYYCVRGEGKRRRDRRRRVRVPVVMVQDYESGYGGGYDLGERERLLGGKLMEEEDEYEVEEEEEE